MAVWVSVQPPFPYFTDTDGSALEDGYIWLGEANKNPQVNPLAVYLDDAFTQPVAQPIRTRSGYPAINGAIVRLYTQENYSIQVNNKNGSLIYSAPTPTEVFGIVQETTNAALVEYDPAGTGAVATTVQAKLRETVSVNDFGAVGDGVTDDTAAIQAALDASLKVNFPPGRYLISSTLTLRTNQTISGNGRSFSYPYYANTNTVYGTEILVSDFFAFDLTGTRNVTVDGIGVRSSLGGDSAFGTQANYGAGSGGFLVTDTEWAQIRNVSFMGLQWGIRGVTATYFMRVDTFVSSDCDNIIRIGDPTSSSYDGRDVQIVNCVYAIHSNYHVEAHWCDGLRLENLRLFQAYRSGIYIRASPFVTLSAVTQFETGEAGIKIQDCNYVTAAAVTAARAGGYVDPAPFNTVDGIYISGTDLISWQGIIERPGGNGINLVSCNAVKLDLAIRQPLYTTQSLAGGVPYGAVIVTTCTNVEVNIALDGEINSLYSIASDFASYDEIRGNVSSNNYAGTLLAFYAADPKQIFIHELESDTLINATGTLDLATRRYLIPAGKKLVSRSMHLTSPTVTLRQDTNFWITNLITESDGGYTSVEKKILYDNSGSGTDTWEQITFQLYNPTASSFTIPAGHKTLVSLAME